MQNRRQSDHLKRRIEELEVRLQEINAMAYANDSALDAELRAIHAALPHYKEAVSLELAKRQTLRRWSPKTIQSGCGCDGCDANTPMSLCR